MTASWRVRSETTDSSNTTRALCVSKLTVASRTPLSFLSVRSLRDEQEAQCIPAMLNVAVFMDSFLNHVVILGGTTAVAVIHIARTLGARPSLTVAPL